MKKVSPLIVELIGNMKFRSYENFFYENEKMRIDILKGFELDGLSKPQLVWSIMGAPFGGKDTHAGFTHDALYATGLFDRRTCDLIFYEIMVFCGVEKSKARAMYYAVRAGGESHYGNSSDMVKWRDYVSITIK
jgi:hypothetical protein